MRYRLALPLVALLLLAACEAGIEAPAETELTLRTRTATEVLPADARYVGKVDLQATQRNPNLDPFENGPFSLGSVQGEAGARLQSFLDVTGFDPRTDIREVYVAIEERDGQATPSLAVYATLDRDRMIDYVDGELGDSFTKSTYRDVPVYTAIGDEEMAFALASDELLVASPDEAAVRAMVDRLADGGRALKDDAVTMQLVRTAGAGDAWFVARGFDLRSDGDGEADALGRAVQDVALSLRAAEDGVTGDVVMKARPGVSVDDLASLTKGAVAAMKSAAKDEAGVRVLDDVHVRSTSDGVTVTFSLDNAFIASMD